MKNFKINIKTKNKKYQIIIGENILDRKNKLFLNFLKIPEKIALVIDSKVPNTLIKKVKKTLNNKKVFEIKINTSEKIKNISTVLKIINILITKNFHRNDCVIALGGGILGDIVSFAASIYKRGIKFINIPTTLLAQVDSSIGGKTGINLKQGKNLVGTFYQPDLVLTDITALKTLPKREMICGYAEILKHSLILNKKLFLWLNVNGNKIMELKNKILIKRAIYESCKLKAKIIQKDEGEKNLRKILNFGHTFAHAFEATNNFSKKINHGEAVLMGMMCAVEFAFLKKILKYKEIVMIKKHYNLLNLKFKVEKFFKRKDINKLIYFMKSDKKNFDQNISLINKIGNIPKLLIVKENNLKKFFKYKLN